MHVGFFVVDIVASGEWQVALQKELRSKQMVAETEEFLLGGDVSGGEKGLGIKLGYVKQDYNG
jgi:hypothetical protein